MKKKLHIIPHTHWDREWYLPFEKHRMKLVDLFDKLICTMEANPDYRYFHMDGQYIVIEDYLQIRPQMRERLLNLVRDGRIQIGPWYVLQDEYLTSGEANIRNMLYGIRLCRDFGAEPVHCGYFPDAFGNISQAPQILRGFGFDHAVFGRGVNDIGADNTLVNTNGITKSELLWRSPDGSSVIGIMFANWYCNAMELPAEPEALKTRLKEIVTNAERAASTKHLLGMNGCDHQPLQQNLPEIISLANHVQDDVEVLHSNFPEYVEEIRKYRDTLCVFDGEINGQLSAGACPLICTASSHADIKQDNHVAQNLLERMAEPAAVMSMLHGGRYDKDYFLYAWKTLMQNHPHDSICSCSVDPVYTEMKTRFAKSIACAQQLRDNALEYLAENVDSSGTAGNKALLLCSFEPNRAVTIAEADVDFDLTEDVQEIAVFDDAGNEVPAKITRTHNQFTYTLPDDRFRQPKYVDRFHIEIPVITNGIAHRVYSVRKQAPTAKTSVTYGTNFMENEFLSLLFCENGTITVTDKRTGRVYPGQNLFEDTQDRGNLYNYVQAPGDTAVTSAECRADISLWEVTPFSVTFRILVPLHIDADIASFVTLSDRIARADFRTVITNRGENHRIRALFPSDIHTDTVLAEGQFDVVRRKIHPEATWKNPCYCQRCQAFTALESDDGTHCLMTANRGLCEYEVLRDGRNTMAITLLRCIGEVGDWGVFPTPLGQKNGTYTLEYSLIPYESTARADAYALGYAFAGGRAAAIQTGIHPGTIPASSDYVRIDNDHIRMSACKCAEDGNSVVLRLFNTSETEEPVTITVPAFHTALLTNLAEEPLETLHVENGTLCLTVPAKKILTLSLN